MLGHVKYLEYVAAWVQMPALSRPRYRVVKGIWGSFYLTHRRKETHDR